MPVSSNKERKSWKQSQELVGIRKAKGDAANAQYEQHRLTCGVFAPARDISEHATGMVVWELVEG